MNERIVVRLEYDYKTMKHYNFYNLLYRKKAYLIYVITGLFSLGLGVWMTFKGAYTFTVVFGILTAYFVYQGLAFEKVIDKQITKFFLQNPKVFVKHLIIDEDEIAVCNPDSHEQPNVVYMWEQISEIHEIPDFFFLLSYKSSPVIISKDPAFYIEGSVEALEALILEKAVTKPFKKIDKQIIKREITFSHKLDDYVTTYGTSNYEVEDDSTIDAEFTEVQDNEETVDVEIVEDLEISEDEVIEEELTEDKETKEN